MKSQRKLQVTVSFNLKGASWAGPRGPVTRARQPQQVDSDLGSVNLKPPSRSSRNLRLVSWPIG
jgi:hypothetical protein